MRGAFSSTFSTTIAPNVQLYPQWQAFLRKQQPETIIFWGQDDIFFTREGGESYLKDLPNAEIHRYTNDSSGRSERTGTGQQIRGVGYPRCKFQRYGGQAQEVF